MVDKSLGKRPISGPRLEREDNIKIGFKKNYRVKLGLYLSELIQEPVRVAMNME